MFKHPICHLSSVVIDEKCVQPNAIDITCDKLFKTKGAIPTGQVVFSKDKTSHSDKIPDYTDYEYDRSESSNNSLENIAHELKYKDSNYVKSDYWFINAVTRNQVRYFESNLYVTVPDKMVGWLVTRSSLNRNGVVVMSGLYDSAFSGNVGGTIYFNDSSYYHLERGMRIAQFVLAEADMVHKYRGQYQGT